MLYFAYGSNLSSARLKRRVPSCRLVAIGTLNRHRLAFHKIGRDGSAKCDAYCTGRQNDYVLGAVFKIASSHKDLLDMAEGLGNGYEIKHSDVILNSGTKILAFFYSATRIDRDIRPFHWYKEHVLRGMKEHGFPAPYLSRIAAVASITDHDSERTEHEMRIYGPNAGLEFL